MFIFSDLVVKRQVSAKMLACLWTSIAVHIVDVAAGKGTQ